MEARKDIQKMNIISVGVTKKRKSKGDLISPPITEGGKKTTLKSTRQKHVYHGK